MPPLDGMLPLFDAAGVRAADARAIAAGTPGEVLMETAGLHAARAIAAAFPAGSAVTVLVGPGNNGGDGMVVARHLAQAGWDVRVEAPGARAPESPDGGLMTARAAEAGIALHDIDLDALRAGGRVVVDALLGTGTRGAPRGAMADAVAALRASGAPVAALDVPTGVDADTGEAPGPAVRACLTVTFAEEKAGLRIAPGRELSGEVVVADIGIPRDLRPEPSAWRATRGVIGAIPPRDPAADKYCAGAVLAVAGAPGGHDAVEEVCPEGNHAKELDGGADAHYVAGLVYGKHGGGPGDLLEHFFLGLSHAYAAYGVPGEVDGEEFLGGALAKVSEPSPLGDAEEVSAHLGSGGLGPCPGTGFGPEGGASDGFLDLLAGGICGRALVEAHGDVGG